MAYILHPISTWVNAIACACCEHRLGVYMKNQCRVLTVLFGCVLCTATMAGPLSVWDSTWTQFQDDTPIEDYIGGGGFVDPGWGGQAFDAEYLFYKIEGNTLYLGLQTGFNIVTGTQEVSGKKYYSGDLALSFDGDVSGANGAGYEYGIDFGLLTRDYDGNDYVDMGTGTGVDGSGLYTATLWNNDMVNSFESVSTPFALDAGSFSRNLLSNSFGSGNNGGLSYYRMVSFDISGLPGLTGYNYIDVHWTMSCGNDNINGRFKVPEPAGVVLMGLGLLGLAATSLRRRRMSELALRLPSNHPFTIGSRQN